MAWKVMREMDEPAASPNTASCDETSPLACIACGYDLRGLAIDGTCPKCGQAVARSMDARRGLTKRELVAFVCKLFAIWLLVLSMQAVRQGWIWLMFFGEGLFSDIELWAVVSAVAGNFFVPALLAVLFWWRSGWMADLIVPRDGLIAAGDLNGKRLMRSAIVVLGLYLLATGVASGLGSVAGLASGAEGPETSGALTRATVQSLFGLALVAGLQRIRAMGRSLCSADAEPPR